MGNIFYFDWEVDLIEWLQQTLGSVGKFLAEAFAFVGGETCMLMVLLIVIFCYRKEAGMRCALRVLCASMFFPMLKNVVLRIRPYIAHAQQVDGQMAEGRIKVLTIVEKDADMWDSIQQGFSMPSGHSATSVAMYGGVALELRKKWMWFLAIALALLIGLSRFIAGVHYPTDVLTGWAVGLLALGFCALLEKKIRKEWTRYLILLAISVPGILWCTSRDYYSSLGLLIGMIAGLPAEKKYVNFQDTRNPVAMVLRIVGAFALYYALNTLLKLPFSSEWLDSGELGPNLVRTARYAVILFVSIAVYPRVFPAFEKIGIRKKDGAA